LKSYDYFFDGFTIARERGCIPLAAFLLALANWLL